VNRKLTYRLNSPFKDWKRREEKRREEKRREEKRREEKRREEKRREEKRREEKCGILHLGRGKTVDISGSEGSQAVPTLPYD
jgi:hypothetical protein